MKIGRLLVVLTTLLLALATPGGVQAGGATAETLHFTFPNNFVLPSPCTGDLIAFTGEVDSVVHVTIDASGQIHVVTSNYVANTIGIDLTTGQTFRNVGAITSEENLESS